MLTILKARFLNNTRRHPNIDWSYVEERLNGSDTAMTALTRMEESGGEPDVIGIDTDGRVVFCDCSKESPIGRRSLCYDDDALRKRKKNPPTGSATAQAREMGVELMDEEMYRKLQSLGEFDLKTSSWIATPDEIRSQGGALFCERRYGAVFTFHNGADSYYGVRGWRGFIKV